MIQTYAQTYVQRHFCKYITIICLSISIELKEEIAQSIRFLIDQGADVNAKTSQGFTALMYASRDGFLETVEHLVSNGADVNSKTKFGYTSLMVSPEKFDY